MRVDQVKVYTYNELSEEAKEKAREWWISCEREDWQGAEYVIEDAERVAEILGIEFDTKRVPLMNGSYRQKPVIYYSIYGGQGDGASFHGTYCYMKGAAKKIREYAPQDSELHAIADTLQAIQSKAFYQLTAGVTSGYGSNFYSHENTVSIGVERDDYVEVTEEQEEGIAECMRDFMRWIHGQLEKQYDHDTSDESAEESIISNEYEFTEDGNIY